VSIFFRSVPFLFCHMELYASDGEVDPITTFSKQSKQRRWSKNHRDRLRSPHHPTNPHHPHSHPSPGLCHHSPQHPDYIPHTAGQDPTLHCVACLAWSLYVHQQPPRASDPPMLPVNDPTPERESPEGEPILMRSPRSLQPRGAPRPGRLSDGGKDVLRRVFGFCDAVDLIIVRFVCADWWDAAAERLYFGVLEQRRSGPRLAGRALQAEVQVATSGFRTQHDAHRFLEAKEKAVKRRGRRAEGAMHAGLCAVAVRAGMRFFFPYFVMIRNRVTKHAVLTFGLRNGDLFAVPWTAILGRL